MPLPLVRGEAMEIYVYINGEKKSLTQLAAESGISYDTLFHRYRAGVPGDKLVPEKKSEGGEEPTSFEVDETLTFKDGVLSVITTNAVEAGNLRPVTSAAVYSVVGNINALLAEI